MGDDDEDDDEKMFTTITTKYNALLYTREGREGKFLARLYLFIPFLYILYTCSQKKNQIMYLRAQYIYM